MVRISSLSFVYGVLYLYFAEITFCTSPIQPSSPSLRKPQVTSKSSSTSTSIFQGDWKQTFVKGNHSVDSNAVTALLNARTAAKSRKDYDEADRSAAQLRAMGVCYDDSQFTWYAKDPKVAATGSPKTAAEPPVAGKKRPRQGASADLELQTKAASKTKDGDRGKGGGGGKGDRSKSDADLASARHSVDKVEDAGVDEDAGGKKKRLKGQAVKAPAESAKAASKAEGAASEASSKAAKVAKTAEKTRKAAKAAPQKRKGPKET
jgi:hypothetical protein